MKRFFLGLALAFLSIAITLLSGQQLASAYFAGICMGVGLVLVWTTPRKEPT